MTAIEPPADTVLLAVHNDSGVYVDVWLRDDDTALPDRGSPAHWFCTGDNSAYEWAEVLAEAGTANCSLVEMMPKPKPRGVQ